MTTGLTKRTPVTLALALSLVWLAAACKPVVQVEMSDKPITINLNVKIEHEIRVKVEKELEDLFSKEAGLF
jgi:hypothetical protein